MQENVTSLSARSADPLPLMWRTQHACPKARYSTVDLSVTNFSSFMHGLICLVRHNAHLSVHALRGAAAADVVHPARVHKGQVQKA